MSLTNTTASVITIGTFDGVHIGHQKIIKKLVLVGKEKQLTPKILTFFPHPRMVLQKEANIKLINTIPEKKDLIEKLGVKTLVIEEFTTHFSELTAKDFVEKILVNKLNAKHIIIGYDHRFGKNRTANIDDLKTYGTIFGFTVEDISAQDINSVTVSSTKIRNALKNGDIATANAYLGYEYILTGTVIKGKSLGHTIGFPTANLYIEETYKLIPKQGVYSVKTTYKNTTIFGMMNIGTNPTVNGEKQSIEIHLFNFNQSIYGETLKVCILNRIRDEHKFESISALQQQLKKDQIAALNFIKTYESISI